MRRTWWRLVGAIGILLGGSLAFGQGSPSEAAEMRAVSTGRSQSYSFAVNGQSINGLYPGQTRYLKLTLTNPFEFPLLVRELHGSVIGTSRRLCAPSPENLVVRDYSGRLPERVPPRSSKTISSLPVYMPRSATRDCASTAFTIHLTASAERAQR